MATNQLNLPSLPEGFVLDQPNQTSMPPLPEGFVLDQQAVPGGVLAERQPAQPTNVPIQGRVSLDVNKPAPPITQEYINSQGFNPAPWSPIGMPVPLNAIENKAFLQSQKAAPSIAASLVNPITGGLPKLLLGGGLSGITAAAGESQLAGKDNLGNLGQGLGLGTGLAALPYGIGKGIRALKTPLSRTASFATELLSSVPRSSTERAIEKEIAGRSIFKGKFDAPETFKKLGSKAQNAINELKGQAGQKINAEQKILSELSNVKIPTQNISDKLNELMQANISKRGITPLNQTDLKNINQLKNILEQSGNRLDPEELLLLKRQLQSQSSFDFNRVKSSTDTGDYILGQLSEAINKNLKIFPKLTQANKEYAKVKNLENRLKTKLKDVNIAKTLRNIESEANITSGYKDLFEQLSEAAPENLKFMEDVQNAIARESFQPIFPGRGGGSGSAQGMANLIRTLGVGASGQTGLLPFMSPKFQGGAIRGLGTAGRFIAPAGKQTTPRRAVLGGLGLDYLNGVE